MEVWKDIAEYEGLYQVSNLGRVKSLDRDFITDKGRRYRRKGKILIPNKLKKGYLQVKLSSNGKEKTITVHRLVLETFKGNSAKEQINHINGDAGDNRLCNLEYVTNMENAAHKSMFLNRVPRGVKKHYNKWLVKTTINGERHYLGYFDTKKEAYKAYFDRYKEVRGIEPWDLEKYPTH